MASQTWSAGGSYTWTAPAGVTQVNTVEAQDASAGGGKGYGGSSSTSLVYNAKHTYSYEGTNADSSPNPGYTPGALIDAGGTGYQGDDQLGDNGNCSTFIVWPSSIPSDIAGGTITDIKIRLNNNHSWYNSGMTYAIGKTSANVTGQSSRPSITDPDLIEKTTAEGAENTYSLSGNLTPFANALAAGDAFVLYHPGSSRTYYGQIAGAGQSGPPQLTIVITFSTTYGGGGGGGGGYTTATNVGVTPGVAYPVYVGFGGDPGGNDQASADGQSGDISSFSGDTVTVAGTSAAQGGTGATSSGAGSGGSGGTGGTSGTSGNAGTGSHGGAGGNSGDGASSGGAASTGTGNDGTGAGAGGGGGYGSGNDGGYGQDGYVTITWTPVTSFSISDTDTGSGSDAGSSRSTGSTSADTSHGTEGGPHASAVPYVGVADV